MRTRREYEPAEFGGNRMCSHDLDDTRAVPGQTIYLHAVYAAPPRDVTTVNVDFPNFGTLIDVPVS